MDKERKISQRTIFLIGTAAGILGFIVAGIPESQSQLLNNLKWLVGIVSGATCVLSLAWYISDIHEVAVQNRQLLEQVLKLNNNELAAALTYIEESRNKNERRYHVKVVSQVLKSMIDESVLVLANRLKQLHDRPDQVLPVKDRSPVYEVLSQMLRDLPVGGIWLGITRLQSPNAWQDPVIEAFANMKNMARHRATSERNRIFRLYYFDGQRAFTSLRDEIDREAEAGIFVRYRVGGQTPPDISILYAPPLDADIIADVSEENDAPIMYLEDKNYIPLCCLRFETNESIILTKVEIHPAGTPEFEELQNQFREYWRGASRLGDHE